MTLSPVSGRLVSVEAKTSVETGDYAIEDTDYAAKTQTLNFAKGETTKSFTVDTLKDDTIESDETFTVTLSSVSNATISTPTATGTIQSDETPAFEISNGTAREADSGKVEMTFTVTLSSGATQTESIEYNTIPGTAKAGVDYIAPVSGNTRTFAPGEQSKTFTIEIVNDDVFELEESFTVQLSGNSSRTALINNGRATGTIEDDDTFAESTISVFATSATVDESEAVKFTFSADPELARELPITILLTETGDFLTIDPATKTGITLPANTSATNTHIETFTTNPENGDFEQDSTVTLTISDANGYLVNSSANSASVVIHDAETPAGISVLAISESVTENSGKTADFVIKSDQFSTSARKINVKIDDGVANFLATPGDSIQTIPANSRSYLLEVPVESDNVYEANGEIIVSILASGGSSDPYTVAGGTNNIAKVPIFDNDAPNVAGDVNKGISIIHVEELVAESDVAHFQVTAKSAATTDRTIRVEVDDGSGDFIDQDNQLGEYTYDKATNIFMVTLPANKTNVILNVILDDDSKNELNGTLTATVLADLDTLNPTYELAESGTDADVTIEDNDPDVPVLSISSDAAGVTGTGVTEGFSFKFKVRSDRNISGSALPILVSADDGTASLGLTIVETKEIAVDSQAS